MAGALSEITRDAFNFPAPLVEVHGAADPCRSSSYSTGPTAAFKGFRPRFLAATLDGSPATTTAPDDPGCQSGDTGAPSQPRSTTGRGRRGRALPARPRFRPPGKSSSLAGPATYALCRRRHFRRLPAHGEGCVRRSRAREVAAAVGRQTASTSAGCCRRWSTTPRPASSCSRPTAARRTSSFRPATSATRSPASGRARPACRSRDPARPATPTRRSPSFSAAGVGGRAEHRYAGVRDGLGNPSNMERLRAIPGRRPAATRRSPRCRSATTRSATRSGAITGAWPDLVPHTATAALLTVAAGATPRRAMGTGGDGASAKFNDIVEPLIGARVPVPPAARSVGSPAIGADRIEPASEALRTALGGRSVKNFLACDYALVCSARPARGRGDFCARLVPPGPGAQAIDNVISSVLRRIAQRAAAHGTGEQIHVNYVAAHPARPAGHRPVRRARHDFAAQQNGAVVRVRAQRHFTFTNPLPMLDDRLAPCAQLVATRRSRTDRVLRC